MRQCALTLGQVDAARESRLKAKEAAEAQEERAILWKIMVALSDVEKTCGKADATDRVRAQARDVVEDIAAHAGEMRYVVLSQPAVAKLLVEIKSL